MTITQKVLSMEIVVVIGMVSLWPAHPKINVAESCIVVEVEICLDSLI
jgi:hypothetical protein